MYGKPIYKLEDIKGLPNVGVTILKKFQEYIDTGTLQVLERAKNDPMLIFTEVYGIGAKKAEELVKTHKVTTIEELRARQDELQGWYEEYVKNENDLKRLEGSMQAIEYVAFGKMPGDGNHDKFKDHTPQAYKEQIPERY